MATEPMPNGVANVAASTAERLACFIARQICNGEFVTAGVALPVPRAGVLLAHLTRCPDLHLTVADYFVNLAHLEVIPDFRAYADAWMAGQAEAILPLEWRYELGRRGDLAFVGGLQVDRYGNGNLIGIGDDHRRLRVRGPGAVGSSSYNALSRRYFIFVQAHSPRVLVERCDFVSIVGWGAGGPDGRKALGLGGGPELVITPRAILDFEPETKAMRLKHLLPGETVAGVQGATGFPLLVPADLESLPEPDPADLAVLRTRVDPQGILRSGAEQPAR